MCAHAQKLLKIYLILQPGFKLCAMDEPFGGATKHSLAQSAADEFIKLVGDTPHVNGLITTHFKAVTRLPASYRMHFMNLKAEDFKIEPGIGYLETEDAGLKVLRRNGTTLCKSG